MWQESALVVRDADVVDVGQIVDCTRCRQEPFRTSRSRRRQRCPSVTVDNWRPGVWHPPGKGERRCSRAEDRIKEHIGRSALACNGELDENALAT